MVSLNHNTSWVDTPPRAPAVRHFSSTLLTHYSLVLLRETYLD